MDSLMDEPMVLWLQLIHHYYLHPAHPRQVNYDGRWMKGFNLQHRAVRKKDSISYGNSFVMEIES